MKAPREDCNCDNCITVTSGGWQGVRHALECKAKKDWEVLWCSLTQDQRNLVAGGISSGFGAGARAVTEQIQSMGRSLSIREIQELSIRAVPILLEKLFVSYLDSEIQA